ncbi:MAG: RiPP maturation radical SAM protein 1 [Candidatus Parabeggiatoa sp. nov. 1]|nr:MAG: RiPP maturation radical SAM protein 1 [Gammaproteobacteria bacterium]
METRSIPKSKTEVCLVQMPYGPLEQPQIGLSILKAALVEAEMTATIFYANLLWAEEIGVHIYDCISHNLGYQNLVGEWTFSEVAFSDFNPNHDDYFHHIEFSLRRLAKVLQQLDEQKNVHELLWELRHSAKAFVNRVAQQIVKLQPRIVGCGSMFQQHCASLALLKKIKALNPNIVTMMGGANCEASMGVVTHKKCAWLDFVVSGEADQLFPSLCKRILISGPDLNIQELPEGVLGPAHRREGENSYARLEQFPPRAQVQDMKHIPIPDYDEYFTALQASAIGDMIKPTLLIETSRGCWWGEVSHCIFCGTNGDSMNYRSKPPERVINEFEYLSQRHQIKNFCVVDNILDMRYFKTVIPTLAEQRKNYKIMYETKANLKREQLRKMAEAGIRWILAGIETFDNTLLKMIGKGTTAHQNLQLMKWAREMGIFNFWSILYDIPGETDDIYFKMLEWLPKISHLQPPLYLAVLEYHRFSSMQRQPARFGLKISPHRAYSFVYPYDEQSLEKFAYFFYDSTKEKIDIDAEADLQRPGLCAVRNYIKNWQQEWGMVGLVDNKPENKVAPPPTLVMSDDGEQLEITDTRSCAIQPQFYLNGLSRWIYHICDQARKQEGLLRELHSRYDINHTWETIEPSVQALCEKGLLLKLNGYYLSLAVPGPLKPMPNPTDSPFGGIESIAYTKIKKLFKFTLFEN